MRDQTANFFDQQAVIDQDSNALMQLDAYRDDEADQRFFARLVTSSALTCENPSSVLPAFLPDFEVKLKTMRVELDGGAFEPSPFAPVGEERDQGAD